MTIYWKNIIPPNPPFYAVIFISVKSNNLDGYEETDRKMIRLARQQPGFLGYCSSDGVFISYWESREAIDSWRVNPEHGKAKSQAKKWYDYYHSMIAKVENSNDFGNHVTACSGTSPNAG